jgi:protein-tyrosine phosphatase/membrane-associated phospholipid phosphatase
VSVSRIKALAASAGLSVLFLVVYSGCNWITTRRGDVRTFYFSWEHAIPFVPLMILPYMSIDLFFVAAPFLFRTNRELQIFSRRIVAAILIAALCFLLFPLRFAFPRPQAEGWLGAIFDWFRSLDAPHNLLPSLHAAFCLLLADVYARHLRGAWFYAAMTWFVLIGLSPLLTYQHHVIDIVGGFVLAGFCFYFFNESSPGPVVSNRRVGGYNAVGSSIALILAVILWPWGIFFLWPGTALGLVAAAYFGAGPGIFRKRHGTLPWSTCFVFGPYLLGQYLSLQYYRRQCRMWDEVTSRVWIGRKLSKREEKRALRAGVTAVLDLTAEFSEGEPFRSVTYLNIPVLDLTAPTSEQLQEMAAFITERSLSGIVYVHCKIGYSRSAAAVAAYLIMSGEATFSEAMAVLRKVRPSIVIRPEIVSAVTEFASHRTASPAAAETFLLASDPRGPA